MGTMLSPGVFWRELDFSTYAINLAQTIYAVVGDASQGSYNPTEIRGVNEMINKFGKPSPYFVDRSLYALDQFFKVGQRALFVRIQRENSVAAVTKTIVSSTPTNLFKISANSNGVWGNSYRATVDNVVASTHEFDLIISVSSDGGSTYSEVERFTAVNLNPDSDRYIEAFINDGGNGAPGSDYVVFLLQSGYVWSSLPAHPVAGDYDLGDVGAGGVAGDDGDAPTVTQYTDALEKLWDAESYEFNLISVPGVCGRLAGGIDSDGLIISALQVLAEDKRRDCLAIIDTPSHENVAENLEPLADPTDVKGWKTATEISSNLKDSSYTCMFWPWVQVIDTYNNNRKIWLPPSGFVAQRMAFTDNASYPWISSSGLNRGILGNTLKLAYVTSQEDRDLLYDRFVNINVIKQEPGVGFVMWGNRTNQSKPTARDQITVRRMLIYVEKIIATSVKYLLFEPNDPKTWDDFKGLVIPVLQDVQRNRGLEDFAVIMDDSTNTPTVRARKEAYGILKLIPMNTVEKINMDFALFASGASFK